MVISTREPVLTFKVHLGGELADRSDELIATVRRAIQVALEAVDIEA